MFWIDADIGIFAMIVVIIIAVRHIRQTGVAKDIREAEARYDRAERKARRRSRWHGTDYEEERRKAMDEAFPK